MSLADRCRVFAERRGTQRDHHALLILRRRRARANTHRIQRLKPDAASHGSRVREPFRPGARPMPGCEADASPLEPWRDPMSRKLIVAIAAVAALGMSTLISTDAFARGGGGHGGGGGHVSGGHGGFSRTAFHGRTTATRTVTRTSHVTR